MLTKAEIRQLQDRELREELGKMQKELMKAKLEMRTGTSKETHKAALLQKQVARIKTIMNEKK